ncbi:MAG TPA: Na+/H+ antiporter subunit C [Verrucomicrobiae bacterium]|nr:Na+/H+ antiporter subunit C [Verrucomicrobiae bacterium]
MELLLAIVIGGLYAAGLYMMMRRSILKLVLGLALLSHAANLLIFTMGGLSRAQPPIVSTDAAAVADPLPQALILTAIVIGFGVLIFALVLVHRVVQTVGADDLDKMKATDT